LAVSGTTPGTTVDAEIVRDGKRRILSLTVSDQPQSNGIKKPKAGSSLSELQGVGSVAAKAQQATGPTKGKRPVAALKPSSKKPVGVHRRH
jgi:hypothetical protein